MCFRVSVSQVSAVGGQQEEEGGGEDEKGGKAEADDGLSLNWSGPTKVD
jgi:hypothetical protein